MSFSPMGILKEVAAPEYRARHIFTAKLRLAIFVGFWLIYLLLFKSRLGETKWVTVAILASFLVTVVCYYNIFKKRLPVPSLFLEIIADLTAMTALVYITGGANSEYYVVYVFYVLAAGLFYNYRLAFFISGLSFLFYALFVILLHQGIIPPFRIETIGIGVLKTDIFYIRPLLLAIFMALAVYATKIAHHFTQLREKMLEARNKELLALQNMSSTIRTVSSLDNVLTEVVTGVMEGLNLKMCLLMLYEKDEKRIRCVPPNRSPLLNQVEGELGVRLGNLYFPMDALKESDVVKQLQQGQVIFRRDINEIVAGHGVKVDPEKFRRLQEKLGILKVVAIPLVTEREVIGALMAFTSEPFVEEHKVQTFSAFADQAALAVEAAMLISELRKKNIALIEAIRVKSEFLATMSHELRTPLTAIIGFSELLIEKVMGTMTEEQEDSLHEILVNATNLLEMINNLLDLAKADSGKMELNRQNFDWGAMLMRIERLMTPLINRKRQRFSLDIVTDIPDIFADEKRMQQIVLNLLSNSIKFTPEEGEISIRTEMVTKLDEFTKKYIYEVDPQAYQEIFNKGVVVCSVEDTGIGIPSEHIPTIFEVFRQVDSSVTKSYEGTGLGLALVKQFVELHGGFVWVESEVGVRTKFTFVVPIA